MARGEPLIQQYLCLQTISYLRLRTISSLTENRFFIAIAP